MGFGICKELRTEREPRVRGEGRERLVVEALAISICRRVCHGVRGAHRRDSLGWGASLDLGTSCGKS